MADPLDPLLLLEMTRRAKKQLRKRLRDLRATYPAPTLARRSARLVAQLSELPELTRAKAVALFYPLLERGEVDTRALDAQLRERNVAVYYPFMDARSTGGFVTGFRLTTSLGDLTERGRGFLEPPIEAPTAQAGDVDVVIVPALAGDGRGHRLGYGSGFYDATLPDVAPPALKVIVVYDFQLLAEIPSEAHDVPCDLVVTDERVLRPNG